MADGTEKGKQVRGQYFSSEKLESLADNLLARYEREAGSPLQPPLQAESIAESISLNILWEDILEEPGTTTHGALISEQRLIVLNERRLQLLESTQGLYNTTIAHEIGHWVLHVDHAALDHVSLPDLTFDSAPAPESGLDKRDERNAHEFMSYLLMPSKLLIPRLKGLNLQNWHSLYNLRETFNVTPTALKIRLEKLNLTYLDDKRRFHKSKQEAGGQTSLF